MIFILDACALLTYLNDESGSDIVEDLLQKTVDGEHIIYMNIVNLIEIHYANIRNLGTDKAAEMLKSILADAIGLATAIERSGHFVSSDHHELEAIAEKESIPFVWLPPHPKK